MAKRLHPGEVIPAIDSGSWNEFVDASEFIQGLQNPTQGDQSLKLPSGRLLASAKLHEALPSYSVVKTLRDATEAPTNMQLGGPPVMDAAAPVEDESFGITQKQGAEKENVPVAILGLSWVKIDIKGEADEVCGVVDDDTEKLESGKGSTRIFWKESGTGVKWAIVLLGTPSPQTILLAQTTSAVTASQQTFTVDNIELINGTDPRDDPSDSNETLPGINNTFGLEMGPNEKVRLEGNLEGGWEGFRPGEGGSKVVRFRLNADLTLAATSVLATMLNDNGTPTAQTITVTDTNAEFTGYGPYTDPTDTVQLGFRGTAIEYDDAGTTKYYLVDIERLFPTILVGLNDDIDTGTGDFETFYQQGFGNSYRIPKRSAPGVMLTYNTFGLADGARIDSSWVAHYYPATDRYELVSVGWMAFAKDLPDFDDAKVQQLTNDTGDLKWLEGGNAVAILVADVPAASGSIGSFTAGVGTGKLCVAAGATYTAGADIPIHNISHTAIRASTGDPIYLVGPVINGALVHGLDLSGLPDFDRTTMQKAIHGANDEAFRLVEECDLDFVTKVTATATKLTFTKRPWDGCTETDVDIIDIGPCA